MRQRAKAAGLVLAVLGVALVVPAANGLAARRQASGIPAKLVGTWTRTVTQTDVTKSGGYGVQIGSKWTLSVKKTGAAAVNSPGSSPITGKILAAGAGRVHINLGNPVTNVYTWRVAGATLTFTKVKDADGDRLAVFAGKWRRR